MPIDQLAQTESYFLVKNAAEIAKIVQGFVSVLAVFGIVVAYRSWKEKQSLDKRVASVAYSLTKNIEYYESRRKIELEFLENFRDFKPVDANFVINKIQRGHEIGRSIRFLLAHWEVMAIQIVNDSLDERVCFEMVGSTLVDTVYVFRPYIDQVRSEKANARRYDYLLILADQWRKRLEGHPNRLSRYKEYVDSEKDIKSLKRTLSETKDVF